MTSLQIFALILFIIASLTPVVTYKLLTQKQFNQEFTKWEITNKDIIIQNKVGRYDILKRTNTKSGNVQYKQVKRY
jgi:hypothetical protein